MLRSGGQLAAAADEVDYFEAVAVFEMGFGPAVAGDDVAVEFDGYAIGLHGEGIRSGLRGWSRRSSP